MEQPAIFTIMDITTDGFGYMLAAGDLLWVPFTYSLQARYLAFEHIELGTTGTAIVVVVAFTGYWIFRSANGEKNDFRNGRNPKSRFFNGIVGLGLILLPQISLIWTRSGEPSF
jgi:delta14-sterol reductase